MRTLYHQLSSLRLAFVLLATLLALIVVSAIVPQDGWAEHEVLGWRSVLGGYDVVESLGLTRIYTSPAFFVILGLLGVNLVAGSVRRFRAVYRAERTLARARHAGSILFHFALVLVIAGAIANYLFKFRGVFAVTEGQAVQDVHADYFTAFSGPLRRESSDRFSLRLEQVEIGLTSTADAGRRASIALVPAGAGAPLRADVAMNHPLRWGEVEFHLGRNVGYSPELLLEGADGSVRFRSFVRLATRTEDGTPRFSDFVLLPEENVRVTLAVVPSGIGEPGRRVTVERGDALLFDGSLAEGQVASFDGYRISVPRLRRWAYVDVVENPFQGTIFLAFWLGLAGLATTLTPRVLRPGRAS